MKKILNFISLNFSQHELEREYRLLKQASISENIKLILFFLVFYLMTIGIPAIIDNNILGFLVTLGTVILIVVLVCLKGVLQRYAQFLIVCIICCFNLCRFFLLPDDYQMSNKGILFFRGYTFATLEIILISRFPGMRQKFYAILVAFAMRFLILGFIDSAVIEVGNIIRHLCVDFFAMFIFYSEEVKDRRVFSNFHEYKESFTKFKDLIANYLPQAIIVLEKKTNKPLFSNKAFISLFNPTVAGINSEHKHTENSSKLCIELLKIEPKTIRELDPKTSHTTGNILNGLKNFQDLLEEAKKDSLQPKAFSFTACYNSENKHCLFEVVIIKLKWDHEDAIAVVLNDITYQENLLALKIADENKDNVIAIVSHELRTPLNGIIGILEMVGEKLEDKEVVEYLNLCKDNAQLLLSLVNSILDLQQIRQGKLRLNPERVDIRKVFQDVMRLFHFQCKQKDIYLKLEVDKDVPSRIYSDGNRLKQILINLIGNAFKFTAHGGIALTVTQDKENFKSLLVTVSDTGIGIKEADKGKLFKKFSRIKDGEKINKNGVGLGLTISNALAHLLSGEEHEKGISVTSSYGIGSDFQFRILKDLRSFPKGERDDSLEHDIRNAGIESRENSLHADLSKEDISSDILEELPLKDFFGSKLQSDNCLKSFSPNGSESPEYNDRDFKHFLFLDCSQPSKSIGWREIKSMTTNKSILGTLPSKKKEKNNKGCVLVVDDNPFNLLVAENHVKRAGYEVQIAKNGQEAIEKVTTAPQPFKAILMDCLMPIMDGFEATRIIKSMKDHEISRIPVIALTAHQSKEEIEKCFKCGMIDYLSKPLCYQDFCKVLSKLDRSAEEN